MSRLFKRLISVRLSHYHRLPIYRAFIYNRWKEDDKKKIVPYFNQLERGFFFCWIFFPRGHVYSVIKINQTNFIVPRVTIIHDVAVRWRVLAHRNIAVASYVHIENRHKRWMPLNVSVSICKTRRDTKESSGHGRLIDGANVERKKNYEWQHYCSVSNPSSHIRCRWYVSHAPV